MPTLAFIDRIQLLNHGRTFMQDAYTDTYRTYMLIDGGERLPMSQADVVELLGRRYDGDCYPLAFVSWVEQHHGIGAKP